MHLRQPIIGSATTSTLYQVVDRHLSTDRFNTNRYRQALSRTYSIVIAIGYRSHDRPLAKPIAPTTWLYIDRHLPFVSLRVPTIPFDRHFRQPTNHSMITLPIELKTHGHSGLPLATCQVALAQDQWGIASAGSPYNTGI